MVPVSATRRCARSVGVALAAGVIWCGCAAVFAMSEGEENRRLTVGFESFEDVRAFAVSNGYAYLAAGYDGLVVIDVRDPSQPAEIGRFDTRGLAGGVALFGGLVLVADGYHGLRVIDIESPTEPFEVGFIAVEGWSNDVTVRGEYALVAAGTEGLVIVDLSRVSTPVKVAAITIDGSARWVTALDSVVCVTDDRGRVHTMDLKDPMRPVETEVVDPRSGESGAPVSLDTECVAEPLAGRDRPSLTWIDAMVFGAPVVMNDVVGGLTPPPAMSPRPE